MYGWLRRTITAVSHTKSRWYRRNGPPYDTPNSEGCDRSVELDVEHFMMNAVCCVCLTSYFTYYTQNLVCLYRYTRHILLYTYCMPGPSTLPHVLWIAPQQAAQNHTAHRAYLLAVIAVADVHSVLCLIVRQISLVDDRVQINMIPPRLVGENDQGERLRAEVQAQPEG